MIEILAILALAIGINGEIRENDDKYLTEAHIERAERKLENLDTTNEGWIWHYNSPLKKQRRLDNKVRRAEKKIAKKKAKLQKFN